ncbi:MAG TPA: hypothetical protein VJN01_14650 [Xanthomonadales bacterium]|nr:hypothetical protein [Xanthomonadales bacterium]
MSQLLEQLQQPAPGKRFFQITSGTQLYQVNCLLYGLFMADEYQRNLVLKTD